MILITKTWEETTYDDEGEPLIEEGGGERPHDTTGSVGDGVRPAKSPVTEALAIELGRGGRNERP